jgi:hypothetical protein
MQRHRGTEHIIGMLVVITAGGLGFLACAIAANADGSMTGDQGTDGTLDVAVGGTLVVAMGKLPFTTLAGLVSIVLVTLGSDPRRPALVVAGYTVFAAYLLVAMLVAAHIGYYGLPN